MKNPASPTARQAKAGTPVPELCSEHGISSATFYKWRSKLGYMEVSMVARMKELEDENRQLKKVYADAQLSADLLKEALSKNGRPSQRREMARRAVAGGRRASACMPNVITRPRRVRRMRGSPTGWSG